jgi:hypothetical protein
MNNIIEAFAPIFAVGFAVQQLLEIVRPILDKVAPVNTKMLLGIISLVVGVLFSATTGVRVLEPLGVGGCKIIDIVVTGLIISAGTEGMNSVMKFLGYKKDKAKEEAKNGNGK